MSCLRIFVLALLVAPTVPAAPALAAPLMPSQAPTMTRVSHINELYGGREQLEKLQRRDARTERI